jgi:hypothetical protein
VTGRRSLRPEGLRLRRGASHPRVRQAGPTSTQRVPRIRQASKLAHLPLSGLGSVAQPASQPHRGSRVAARPRLQADGPHDAPGRQLAPPDRRSDTGRPSSVHSQSTPKRDLSVDRPRKGQTGVRFKVLSIRSCAAAQARPPASRGVGMSFRASTARYRTGLASALHLQPSRRTRNRSSERDTDSWRIPAAALAKLRIQPHTTVSHRLSISLRDTSLNAACFAAQTRGSEPFDKLPSYDSRRLQRSRTGRSTNTGFHTR